MIAAADVAAVLRDKLPAHIGRQRWAGAGERGIRAVEVDWLELVEAGDPMLVWAVVVARFEDGGEQAYQVFVGGRPAEPACEFLEGKERELVGVATDDEGDEIVLYDALVDPDLAIAVLHLAAPDIEVEVRRPIVLEHSNSSVVFDESTILKIFRKVEPGPNPDVEITRVLAERGYEHVLPPLAELERDDTDLAVLREFLVGATEGWLLARTSVRDLLASRLAPEECGGDFGPDCERLGAVIGGLHMAMAGAWGTTDGDVAGWVGEMEAHLKEVLGTGVPDELGALDVDAVADRYRRTRSPSGGGKQMRIHGDLHLAQVIRVDAGGWKVLDFEGEPARRRDERFTVSSPLRDVAGMLRSLHYAAATGLTEWDLDDRDLRELLEAWEQRNRAAFLDGYLGVEGVADLLPSDPADLRALLAAFELDKAIYELGYEIGHRPELAWIPLEGIDRLLRGELGGEEAP